jgi:O-methyltransferase
MNFQEKQQQNHLKHFLSVTEKPFIKSYDQAKEYTMLSPEVLYDLWLSTKYIVLNNIQGDIVEYGVWKGGALQIIIDALQYYEGNNKIYGYDTFEGHPEPDKDEIDIYGKSMLEVYLEKKESGEDWAKADYLSTKERLDRLIKGLSFELIKKEIDENFVCLHDQVSILRLDLDWYSPTKKILEESYKKISRGGVLIIDDYGHHSGARKAIDEFFSKREIKLNFRHVNYSCVAATVI